ncbi:hypothetical protein J0S82_000405 [Galemys pyrenaicus]|uniref:Uncharacterized protein n=1 Tax=Galemys pyrenaicus TaxID=202257 RepID=A0A8J6A6F7_GALPY|nr:hypothetical protein J0S82_000405 [Galemys pyrenaicus]
MRRWPPGAHTAADGPELSGFLLLLTGLLLACGLPPGPPAAPAAAMLPGRAAFPLERQVSDAAVRLGCHVSPVARPCDTHASPRPWLWTVRAWVSVTRGAASAVTARSWRHPRQTPGLQLGFQCKHGQSVQAALRCSLTATHGGRPGQRGCWRLATPPLSRPVGPGVYSELQNEGFPPRSSQGLKEEAAGSPPPHTPGAPGARQPHRSADRSSRARLEKQWRQRVTSGSPRGDACQDSG